ncbi:mobilization protein [Kitasatospora brasiliensis]|uniref:mobilization protein n=1 Tax=Kitasatospora brasiliensis TaxID=3058040 RepID=UPI00292F4EBB|nr:mobilization protein [Kitasatospora sp. K002]
MIPKKARAGNDTAGLLRYLYGPGRRDEHVDPRMVAAWAPGIKDPARSAGVTIGDLALLLDAPVHALIGKRPTLHVHHVAVRNPPEDRLLTDEQWAEVAREMMNAAGLAAHGDDQGCRWVAIRHAADHIHIVATRARQGGGLPNLHRDIPKMHAAARRFEARWELRCLDSGDRTANRWPQAGEAEKAARRQLPRTARETLQQAVREAAATAGNEEDFFARLAAAGLRVNPRIAPDGQASGYSVALPGDRDGAARPVWFSGSRLAYDLSLPRVRERWVDAVPQSPVPTDQVWKAVETKVRLAAVRLGAGGPHQGAGDVAALGDLVVVLAANSPRPVREQLRRSAAAFERASRAPGPRALDGEARALWRESAKLLSGAGAAAGHNDTAAFLGVLLALVTAVAAAQRWHEARNLRAQAQAASVAGQLLREAVEVSSGAAAVRDFDPRTPCARRGAEARWSAPIPAVGSGGREPNAALVRQTIPEHAAAVLADPAWPALHERLAGVGGRGDDPARVLAHVAAGRELGSANSVAEVLCWRLDGWLRARGRPRPAPPAGPVPGSGAQASRTLGSTAGHRPDPEQKGPRRAR